MAELRIPEPSEKQCLFMADRHKYIGYGGARGGGKSWAVRVKAVLLCLRDAGVKGMIITMLGVSMYANNNEETV